MMNHCMYVHMLVLSLLIRVKRLHKGEGILSLLSFSRFYEEYPVTFFLLPLPSNLFPVHSLPSLSLVSCLYN